MSVGGDGVQHVLYRLQGDDGLLEHIKSRPESLQPKRIIFMCGGNNKLSNSKRVNIELIDRIINTVEYIFEVIKQHLPKIQIECWAIPIDRSHSESIIVYNQRLKDRCASIGVMFSDEFFNETMRRLDIHEDDVHLNKHGYHACMLPLLNKL